MIRQLSSLFINKFAVLPVLSLLLLAASPKVVASDLVIAGVVDGPLSGGVPKAVEIYVVNNVGDLSIYGLGSANNGGGTDGQEFTFPAIGAIAGDYIYVASESSGFNSFFGFAPDYTSGAMAINGDDAVELFQNGAVVDVFGDINVDGSGQPWDHLDGWAYRIDNTGPDCSTFALSSWSFSGINALDAETTNAGAATPLPLGTFTTVGGGSATCVTGISPAPGSIGVPVDTDITIDFNDVVTATATAITVSCDTGGTQPGTISGSPSTTIVWDGDVDLGEADVCTVTVAAAQVTDADSNPLSADIVFSFTTAGGAGAAWVINEMHADPDGSLAGDANGDGTRNSSQDEFVEIVNVSGSDADITGWTVSDGFGVRHTFPAGTVVPDQCSIVVFGGGTPTGDFGNSVVQTASGGSLGLNNGGDSVTLNDGSSDVVTATYGGEGGANQSLTLDPDVSGIPPHVQHTLASGSGGTLYSPGTNVDGTAFAGCPPPPATWVINEFHADPASGLAGDANGDGTRSSSQDEFVEIFNVSGSDADISGWTVSDGVGVRHTFPAGTLVLDQCSIVVFGGGTPTGVFGNSVVQTASAGFLGLNNGGDGIFLNDGSSDVASASYGREGSDNQSLTLDPDVSGALPYVKHTVASGSGGTLYSPGTKIDGTQFFGCPLDAEIFEIQGAGLSSPLATRLVNTTDNVVTAVGPDGFAMQTPSSRSDGDIDTSDGIFVFTGSAPAVAVGELVDVSGRVQEFFGFTEFGFGSIVTATGFEAPPPPVQMNSNVPSPLPGTPSCAIEFECYEGMLVEIADGTVTGPNQRFNPDPIAEVHITAAAARTFREPGIEHPGEAGLPLWDGNPEVFELDPDKLGLSNQIIPAGSSFNATGIIGFEFGGYELWPTELSVSPAPLPVAVRAREAGEFTVGTLNLFRLFSAESDYATRLTKFSLYIRTVLDAPDILAVQEVESLAVLQDLADKIAFDYGIVYTAHLIEGNDIGGIDVGFLTRDNITVDAITQVDPAATFINPITQVSNTLHDRPPLLLEGSSELAFGTFPIAVMAVHNRSLGGIDGSEALRVRVKRLLQAESIALKVQDLQTAVANLRLVVTGDFNAFEFTDGHVDALGVIAGNFNPATSLVCSESSCQGDIVEPNLDNQVLWLPGDERYSFIFRGNAQVLDHALTSAKLADEISGIEYGRGNADAAVDLINDGGHVLRSSDHDGLVVYITQDKDADGVPNDDDFCPGTTIPETLGRDLGVNRFTLVDGDFDFDTTSSRGKGPGRSYTTGDTAGCSCTQIIAAQGLGKGHTKFGCSIGAMENWISLVNQ